MKTLIDKAVKKCGSVAALAERLDVAPNVISMMRHGRAITPETAAELAAITGDDAGDAAIMAIIERARGTRREEKLKKILGRSLEIRRSTRRLLCFTGPVESDLFA